MLTALTGGMLIGLSAALLYVGLGRIAGISGIAFGFTFGPERLWRWLFLLGLIGGGWLAVTWLVAAPAGSAAPAPLLLLGGALVGFGTRLGNGCTSGHGVCGLSRLSPRSLAAVAVFMAVGMLVATALRGVFA